MFATVNVFVFMHLESSHTCMELQLVGHSLVVYIFYRIVHHKMVDNKEVTMSHMDKLAGWLSSLQAAFRDGDASRQLLKLPEYYRIIDKKVSREVKRPLEVIYSHNASL